MKIDRLVEIGIDDEGKLYLKPESSKFPYIYREAMEVQWEPNGGFLYGPRPRSWSYVNWYKQIIDAARQQGINLILNSDTDWKNIDSSLKNEIRNLGANFDT